MKKAAVLIAVVALLTAGVAYGHMRGYSGGPMHDGDGMMKGSYSAEEQKVLDETSAMRKDLHSKKFDLREAMRKGEYEKAEAIEKDIASLKEKLSDKLGTIKGLGKGKGKGGRFDGRPCGGPNDGDAPCPGPCGGM